MLTFMDPAEEATLACQGYVVRHLLDQRPVDVALWVMKRRQSTSKEPSV
jgi:hypothetical protein